MAANLRLETIGWASNAFLPSSAQLSGFFSVFLFFLAPAYRCVTGAGIPDFCFAVGKAVVYIGH